MTGGNTFKITLFISFVAHSIIFLHNPIWNLSPIKKDSAQQVELSYIKKIKEPDRQNKDLSAKRELFLRIPDKIAANNRTPPPFSQPQDVSSSTRSEALARNRLINDADFIKPRTASIKNKMILSSVNANLSHDPAYLGYYQIGREKIKRAAFQQNYGGREEGEVAVFFTITNDGILKELRLIEKGSCRSPYLRDIALASVKEAAPFPKFPPQLDYPELSFNLTMTFEAE